MTSEQDNSLIDEDDPLGLTALPTQKDLEWRAHLELVRQQCVAEFSSSPLYQAAAAKDPEYWNEFSMGRVHLY
jgi:hypothetical protein